MLSNNWTFIGGATAAFLAAVYVFWGPSKPKKRKGFPGLVNLGNSCYLNVILQSWAACPSLLRWLGARCTSTLRATPSLTSPLLKVLKVLNNVSEEEADVPDVYCPDQVMTSMNRKGWVISPGQQDCHELMQALSSTLDEEASVGPKVLSLFDVSALQDSRGGGTGSSSQMTAGKTRVSSQPLPVLPRRQESPLHGLLASQLQCLTCGHQSPVKYDVFDCITLTLPPCSFPRQLDLESLLERYVRPEMIDNAHCDNCCSPASPSSPAPQPDGTHATSSVLQRTLTIGKLPQCLVIHLQRLHVGGDGVATKRQEHVTFPDTLSMDAFLYSKAASQGSRHRLCGGKQLPARNNASSGPVNLLRALNYDGRISRNGLFLRPPSPLLLPSAIADVNHNGPPASSPLPDVNHNGCYKLQGAGDRLNKQPQKQQQHQYQLTAVISHLGDVESGHFVTYRRGPLQPPRSEQAPPSLPDAWWLASDACVKRASLQQLHASQAYMLFYERS